MLHDSFGGPLQLGVVLVYLFFVLELDSAVNKSCYIRSLYLNSLDSVPHDLNANE